ncbi:glycine/D-amino acid oxidase-like deaminating enzyme [Larkinella arboricola]|uniref:Glycine/D-amino acid oxidase-like deaminating enzyme n=1 Tax=Larkinella arboricola TaxID=643671 RepID=A0A327X262_LARAB|nr:FAD-dependent oxidoreductase [Larkinella arboricola]RAK00282.1 glycine/D-amino acid oxidase-like deaminating enzyme [Larkinella arboricola]
MNTDQKPGARTSGEHLSFWIDTVDPIQFSPLNEDRTADVVVVGAGISGLSVAYNLAKAGKKVIVLEDGFVGSGETGRTTAHLSNALDDSYTEIEHYHGEEGARIAAESHTEAINFIERTVQEEGIDCDFERLNGYLFLHPTDQPETLNQEFAASHRAGIDTHRLAQVPGFAKDEGQCLQFPNQAQFHPMKYLKGLTDAFVRLGGEIFTETRVTEVREDGVKTDQYTVTAADVVVATNTPINDLFTMHTKQWPYRTYVVGVKIPKGSVPTALWWDTGDQESEWVSQPYTYVRLQRLDAESDLVICGGHDHKTGQADEEDVPETDRYPLLIDWIREHFPMATEVVYRWSGQVMEPLDAMAFIGKNPGNDHIYIVTGDSGNGMTHGTIAGLLIPDLILGRENPWAKLYDPSRISLKVTGDYLKETGNFTKQLADFFMGSQVDDVNDLTNGQGAIINSGLQKIAAYRDEQGELHTHSALCPHMGCVVQWNADEKSFDCPCHGSRFTGKGVVVNGPAASDLKAVTISA